MSEATYKDWHRTLRRFKLSAEHYPCGWCGDSAARWVYLHNRPDIERGAGQFVYAEDTSAYAPLCNRCAGTFRAARTRLSRDELAKAVPALALAAHEGISDYTRAEVIAETARRRETAPGFNSVETAKPFADAVRATDALLRQAYGA
ncbi:hypothetical protein ACH4JZ_29165 [Streptomyces sp. NPDC017615]|uniref:hypothetical protein n=1 Tax=Streptomyces sp. NPDC017615 TaxID=3365003 RepID=UPI0037BACFAC